jgi:uncharacterized Fe-S center protein
MDNMQNTVRKLRNIKCRMKKEKCKMENREWKTKNVKIEIGFCIQYAYNCILCTISLLKNFNQIKSQVFLRAPLRTHSCYT